MYNNFRVAIYLRAQDAAALDGDITPLKDRLDIIERHLKVDKIYVETHRDTVIPSESTLVAVRDYLNSRGIETSGGLTITIAERDNFRTFCYSDPEHRQKLKDIVTLTARLFDEVIFDDFFFTNCKCPLCIKEKGGKTWTQFRLEQMTQASRDLVLEPARTANPDVKVVIKYPNWYEHFQGLGFNLKDQPPIYDGIYTGNETRDAVMSDQHLQPYEGYLIFRYFENIKPGGNLGGWVDPFGIRYLDRYSEQLWLTLFAKAPEITLFDYHSLRTPIKESHRGPWQGHETSFDFDSATALLRQPDGSLSNEADMVVAAGAALEQVDKVLGQLGIPIGIKSYKPYHSTGEDFLHNYLGMLGIPIDLVPEFPADAQTVLLTECAACDTEIVSKIKAHLLSGRVVVITSGLLKALQGKGLQDIVEMECTDRELATQNFKVGWNNVFTADKPLMFPIIRYLTNDSWEQISCMGGTTGSPLLHYASYGNSKLWVMTIPDNFDDLYHLPAGVLNQIRKTVAKDMYVRLEGPSKVTLFVYDNNTFVVHSFLDENAEARFALDETYAGFKDLLSGKTYFVERGRHSEPVMLKPHSFRVFQTL